MQLGISQCNTILFFSITLLFALREFLRVRFLRQSHAHKFTTNPLHFYGNKIVYLLAFQTNFKHVNVAVSSK